jgi:hypothetical protein
MFMSGKEASNLIMIILLLTTQTQAILLPLLMGLAVIPQLFTTTDHLKKTTTTTTTTTATPPPMEWNLFWREEIFRKPAPSIRVTSWERHGAANVSLSSAEINIRENYEVANASFYDVETNINEKHKAVTNSLSDVETIREQYQEFRDFKKDGLGRTKEKLFNFRMSPFARRLAAIPDPPKAMRR